MLVRSTQIFGAAALALAVSATAALTEVRIDQNTVSPGDTLDIEVDIPAGDAPLFLWLRLEPAQEADFHAGEIDLLTDGPLTPAALPVEPGSVLRMSATLDGVWCGLDALTQTCPLGTGAYRLVAQVVSRGEPGRIELVAQGESEPLRVEGPLTPRQKAHLATLLMSQARAEVSPAGDVLDYQDFAGVEPGAPLE